MGLKDLKRNFIIDTATSLFLDQSIESITIRDIAQEAELGEATIYRYFGNKVSIVAESVMKLQGIVSQNYFKLEEGKTGLEKLSIFYHSYLDVFNEKVEFYRFIREFDLFMLKEDNRLLSQYENEIDKYKNAYIEAYELGLKDGSIKEIENIEIFYFASTHALLELCKKLSYGKSVLPQDERISKSDEIKCLINSFLKVLTNS